MSDLDAALGRLRTLHDRLDAHDTAREELMRERDLAMRDAKAAGATYEAIRDATGLANASITKALGRG